MKGFVRQVSGETGILLEFIRDFWFKDTLDVLQDEEKYVLDINEGLHASLGLFVYLVELERKHGLKVISDPEHLKMAKDRYF